MKKWIIILFALTLCLCSNTIKKDRDMYIQGYTDGWRDGIIYKAKQDSIEKAIEKAMMEKYKCK